MGDVELSSYPCFPTTREASPEESSAPNSTTTGALPPVDGGRDAWLFLLSATIIEVLVWGLPFSVGVLHSYWSTTLFPPGTPGTSLLSLAATLQTGLMYCSAIGFGPLIARYPHQRAKLQLVGLAGSVAGVVGSAFATKPWHLVLTLGILYPLSGLFYLPAAVLLFEWWSARRGFASGIMYGGTGAGGAIFPFVMQGLLNGFGYRAAMISLGIGYGAIGMAAMMFIKPRVPLPLKGSHSEGRHAHKLDTSFLRHSPLYAFSACILLTSLGNFIPSVWVPTASVPGLLLLGWLSDRWPLRVVITLSCLGSALACLFVWGFATDLAVLSIFVVAFGALGLSFSALWTRLITVIAGNDPALPGHIFSIFAFVRGIGNISSGPVANKLLASNLLGGAAGGYGVKNYGSLLLYTGLTIVAGSVAGVLYREKDHTPSRQI